MSEFKPININFGGNNGSNGQKGTTEKIITVIIIIIAIILMFKSPFGDEGYYSGDYVESNNSSSQDLLELLLGGGTQNTSSNVDYSAYEDGTIKNVSEDKYTLMVYMCGSNLESDGGYASSDLEEMLKSSLADEVNLLVYTGGAKRWFDYGISNKTNQIYKIENHKLNLVATDIGVKAMGNPNTLLEFLNFGKENYPAQKYSLIMWDHGGGADYGFGLDELANKNDALLIDEMKQALDSFGQKLEFIGFDACLMANLETAYALKNNANYLIASE